MMDRDIYMYMDMVMDMDMDIDMMFNTNAGMREYTP
jgi:hypothetical protein